MPLQIVRNDITKMKCDAIVNAANSSLLGGGGVDGAIHKAAGEGLLMECRKLGGCGVGRAKATGAYRLPCRYVIHTVGPKWRGGTHGEKELLESCYRESLKLAVEKECESVAFPLISSGIYGYPKDQALQVAVDSIREFLADHDMLVYIVVFDKDSYRISETLITDVLSYIDDRYVDESSVFSRTRRDEEGESAVLDMELFTNDPDFGRYYSDQPLIDLELSDRTFSNQPEPHQRPSEQQKITAAAPTGRAPSGFGTDALEKAIEQLDESFSEMLLRKIAEKGMTDSECYKKANVDRKLFSKIRSRTDYHPSKATAIAFAIALELNLEETGELLMKAGFALSHSSKFDIIIEYFITRGNYNIFEINEVLFAFDQNLLGA